MGKKHCVKKGYSAYTYIGFVLFTLLIASLHLVLGLTKVEGS
jgi:hypothetical protein